MNDFAQQLKTYLLKTDKLKESDLVHDMPLFSSGVFDSFDMMDLVFYIEKTCSFKVKAKEITLENFDTVQSILLFTEQKNSA